MKHSKPETLAKPKPEIKPCPFCGRKATEEDIEQFGICWVSCGHGACDTAGPTRKTRAGAIKAWNRRVA